MHGLSRSFQNCCPPTSQSGWILSLSRSLSLYIYIYTSVYKIYIYVYGYTYIYIYTCIHTYIYIYTYMHISVLHEEVLVFSGLFHEALHLPNPPSMRRLLWDGPLPVGYERFEEQSLTAQSCSVVWRN